MNTTRIVIADDHPIFLSGLKEVIEKEEDCTVAGCAANGREAVELVKKHEPDLVVLDIDMPELNGIEAAKLIQGSNPDCYIVFLTMHKERDLFLEIMEMGIQGYVLKEDAVLDIGQSIRSVMRGGIYISPAVSRFLLPKTKVPAGELAPLDRLTAMELKILRLVAESKTSRSIAEECYISEKTVSNHRHNISKKLDIKGSNSLLLYALENKDLILNG